MTMLDYLGNLLRNLFYLGSPPETETFSMFYPVKLTGTIVFASLGGLTWNTLPANLHEFLNAVPVVTICILWTLDMLLGTALALMKQNYSPRKSLLGLIKFLTYAAVLAVAYLSMHDGTPLDDWLRIVLEAAVILTEMSSVLRNAAKMSEVATGKKSKVLDFFGDQINEIIENKIREFEDKSAMMGKNQNHGQSKKTEDSHEE